MRHHLKFLIFCLFGTYSVCAQDCRHIQRLMEAADEYWKKGMFEKAFNFLSAAREHCPDSFAMINNKSIAFTNEITRQYEDAKKNQTKAEISRYKEIIAREKSDSLLKIFQLNVEASRLTALAIDARNNNTSLAYSLLKHACKITNNTNELAIKTRHDLWNDTTAHPAVLEFSVSPYRILSISFSPKGNYVLTGLDNFNSILWDLNGKQIQSYSGHIGPVTSVAFSSKENTIITGSVDGTAILWDLKSGDSIRVFRGHSGKVNSVVFSPNENTILTGSSDSTAILWDLSSGDTIRILKGHSGPIHSVSITNLNSIVTSSMFETILWLPFTDKMDTIRYQQLITSIAISPSGLKFLEGTWHGRAQIGYLYDTQLKSIIVNESWYRVISVAFSPDGELFLTLSENGTAKLWKINFKEINAFKAHLDEIFSPKLSQDGKYILTGSQDSTALLWDLKAGSKLKIFKNHSGPVYSTVFSPNEKYILTGSQDSTAILWDIKSGLPIKVFEGHLGSVYSVAFSSDGENILTGSQDSTAILWDIKSGLPIKVFEGHLGSINSVAYSPSENKILTGSSDRTAALWDVKSETRIKSFVGHKESVTYVAFSRNSVKNKVRNQYALTCSRGDHSIKLWDATINKKADFPLQSVEDNYGYMADFSSSNDTIIYTSNGLVKLISNLAELEERDAISARINISDKERLGISWNPKEYINSSDSLKLQEYAIWLFSTSINDYMTVIHPNRLIEARKYFHQLGQFWNVRLVDEFILKSKK